MKPSPTGKSIEVKAVIPDEKSARVLPQDNESEYDENFDLNQSAKEIKRSSVSLADMILLNQTNYK